MGQCDLQCVVERPEESKAAQQQQELERDTVEVVNHDSRSTGSFKAPMGGHVDEGEDKKQGWLQNIPGLVGVGCWEFFFLF